MKGSGSSGISLIMKRRMVFVFACLCLIILLFIIRAAWIQIIQGPELKKMAVEQWDSEVKIDARRGEILDRNGRKLAVSTDARRIDVYMPDVAKAEESNKNIKKDIASKIAGILGDKTEDILKKLNTKLSNGQPARSVTIKRRIDVSQGDGIKKLGLPGIIVSEDTKRFYPNGSFLSQVLGFTNIDGKGQEGIESKYEEELKGTPGTMKMEADVLGRQIPYDDPVYNAPANGKNIVLTIDESIQLYVEKALEEALVKNKAKSATAIVMDPKTGEILAMASKPDFDPNNPKDMTNYKTVEEMMQPWKNRAVAYTYEPGSVFKLLTATAALGENIVNDSSRFNDPGYLVVGGRKIYDWNRAENGVQDFAEILQNSSNVGFALLGEELGRDKLYKYIDNFGFGKKTGIDVSFEESGYKTPINKVGPVELANISFGQGIAVTPIQMVSAYAAIANGGKMMAPHLVKSIVSTDQDGKAISSREIQPALLRQAVDKETADKLMEYLETVVAVGGGHEAYIQGYRIAGKTGTAQKAENGGYASGKYIDTFIGVAPADNPQFVVLVSVDEPNSSNYYASHVVAPVAGQIFRDIFSIRNMSPDMGDGSGMGTIPDVTGLTQRDAEKRLKFIGFKVEVNGNGTAVKTVNPASGTSVKLGSVVKLGMGNVDNYSTKVVVPQINGMGAKQAQSLLDSLGLKSKISGGGRISSQNPAAGNIVDKGAVISAQAR